MESLMIFLIPIILLFALLFTADALFYNTDTNSTNPKSIKEKNVSKKEISAQEYLKKYIDK